jgi:hypothetical protein
MATYTQGIDGPFSGKIGNVIGAHIYNIDYMRSMPARIKNPRTPAQTEQRSKFAIAIKLMRPLVPILKKGWKNNAVRMSEFNAAVSHTIQNAIKGKYPNHQVNYQKILISKGNLSPIKKPKIKIQNQTITLSWTDNSLITNANPSDKLLLAIINQTQNKTSIIPTNATRTQQKLKLQYSASQGDTIHIYIGLIGQNLKQIANSHAITDIKVMTELQTPTRSTKKEAVNSVLSAKSINNEEKIKKEAVNNVSITVSSNKENKQKKIDTELQTILQFIAQNPLAKTTQIQQFCKKSRAKIQRNLKILIQNNQIKHIGSPKTGGYHIIHTSATPL